VKRSTVKKRSIYVAAGSAGEEDKAAEYTLEVLTIVELEGCLSAVADEVATVWCFSAGRDVASESAVEDRLVWTCFAF
jgi:hypothetical protein